MIEHLSIREIRQKLGLTQAELARKLCVSSQSIFRWEKNLHKPIPLAQAKLLEIAPRSNPVSDLPKRTINSARMIRYFSPCPGWTRWKNARKAGFRSAKLRYQRMLAEEQAGRCVIVYKSK